MTEEKVESAPLAKVEVKEVPPPPPDMIVLARDPAEMKVAQSKLISWAEQRIVILEGEVAEAKENLELAKKGKYKTRPWTVALSRAEGRVVFYQNMKRALEEGYCIVPDFPLTVIAVRTNKESPNRNAVDGGLWRLPDVTGKGLPVGEGHHVGPRPLGYTFTVSETKTDSKGEQYKSHRVHAKATAYDQVDFPFHLVKPQVLESTNRAMALKLFDEIGVLPQQKAAAKRNPDPIVAGRIIRREGTHTRSVTFLISWWIDTRDL